MKERHLGIVSIDHGLFAQWVRQGVEVHVKCVRGVPADAQLISTGYDWDTENTLLRFEHDSFPVVREGEPIPKIVVEFELDDGKWREID